MKTIQFVASQDKASVFATFQNLNGKKEIIQVLGKSGKGKTKQQTLNAYKNSI